MGIFRAVGMELELESRSAGLSNADVLRGDVTAAASNPPVVVMKFLRLRECGAECGSMYVPRPLWILQSRLSVVPAESAETDFRLRQHYTHVSLNMAENPQSAAEAASPSPAFRSAASKR